MKTTIIRYCALLFIFACLLVGSVLLACEHIGWAFVAFAVGIILTQVFDRKHLLPE